MERTGTPTPYASPGPLMYAQAVTRPKVINAPAIPLKIHSRPTVGNTTVLNQGITCFQVALATIPARKPSIAKVPIILTLSPIPYHP